MKTILIQLDHQCYNVTIGKDVLKQLLTVLDKLKSVLIITDNKVAELYINYLKKYLNEYKLYFFNMDHAEENKNLTYYEMCVKYALENYLDRDLQVIAFGGGAVGDFAGFFASTYKRGVKFINLPTTLLAHDSAVGGKVAVNVAGVKNVIGTFYQPVAVIYYTEFLKSLAFNEIKSGFGEVFKHDLLHDGSILNALLVDKTNLTEIIHDDSLIEEIIYRCIEIKKKYIIHDIEDKLGIRQALNLGHTLAHAIEILYNTTHGEAVAFGICFDLFLSKNVEYEFYYKLFKKFGYFDTIINIDILDCVETMKNDKKNKSGLITFVGLKEFGRPFEIYLTEDEINIKLTEFLNIIKSW